MLDPQELFSPDIMDYEVTTSHRGTVRFVNLDNAATTPPLRVVEDAVAAFLRSYGSVHRGSGAKSRVSTLAYEKAREQIKAFVNAPDDSYLLFTGNTTGAMNVAAHLLSFIHGKVAVSAIEHSSSWLPWVVAEGTRAIGTARRPPDELPLLRSEIQELGLGQVLQYEVNDALELEPASVEALLRNNSIKAVVLTASSNLTGYCPDVHAIGKLAHRYGALFVVDACQYLPHHTVDMQAMGIDLLAFSGHKIYAPYGGGALIGPKSLFDSFVPYQIGGGNLPYITKEGRFIRAYTEHAQDAGTPNVLGAVSIAAALSELNRIGYRQIRVHEKTLTQQAYQALEGNARVKLHVSSKHLQTIIPFTLAAMSHLEAAERLNTEFGIGVRAGSFCVYHAIRSLLGIEEERDIIAAVEAGEYSKIPGVIRASFSLCNSDSDVSRFIDALETLTTE